MMASYAILIEEHRSRRFFRAVRLSHDKRTIEAHLGTPDTVWGWSDISDAMKDIDVHRDAYMQSEMEHHNS